MKSFTQNEITFNKYRTASDGQAVSAAPVVVAGQEGVDSNFGGIINAVDIDWNGAVLPDGNIQTAGSVTINTSGELLNLINEMQKEIYVLSAAVIAIGSKVS